MEIGSYQTLDPRRSRKDLYQPREASFSRKSVTERDSLPRKRSSSTSSTNMEVFTHHQHSLSQDSASASEALMMMQPPPPTLSRLPPDGHEFPPDYRDPTSNTFQNSEILSRKSSASSTGSLDRAANNLEKKRPLMKHDEHSASSVKAKIAMFSTNAKPSSSSVMTTNSTSMTASLTRSLTHGDVRFEEINSNKSSINPGIKSNNLGYRSMVNMNKEFNQSTDSLVRTTHARLSRLSSENNSKFGGRSQSLMEIGSALPKRTLSSERGQPTTSPHIRSQSSSGLETSELPIEQRRKNTLTKMKGLVIPEVNNEAMASPPPSAASTPASKLSMPPWKQQTSSSSDMPSSKYSPAYKRKPFSVYGNNNGHGNTSTTEKRTSPTSSSNNNNSTNVKSDDSDNDSAVSSGRSSLSHSSVSPPASPKSAKNRPLPTETIQESSSEASSP